MMQIKKIIRLGKLLSLSATLFYSGALTVYAAENNTDSVQIQTAPGTETPEELPINEETFPDEAFRGYIVENVDQDKLGTLSPEELEQVTEMNVSGLEIRSLSGISYFPHLSSLDCSDNNLTELDLSGNTELLSLDCSDNTLTELDLSGNTELLSLDCSDNTLTELDLGNNTELSSLSCSGNALGLVDLRNCEDLEPTEDFYTGVDLNTVFVFTDSDLGWFSCRDKTVRYVVDDATEPKSSHLYTGWLDLSGERMYFAEDGALIVDTIFTVDGKRYYFNTGGIMQTGWQLIRGELYYFSTDGIMQTGWQKLNEKWYFFRNGCMQTGWLKLSGKWYYLNEMGIMADDWQLIDSKWYLFRNGVMQTGWQAAGGKLYYLNANGSMRTGWFNDQGKWYFLNPGGQMQTGWRRVGNAWYFFGANGTMVTGWRAITGKWYYFSESGEMLADTWVGKYYLDINGVWNSLSKAAKLNVKNILQNPALPNGCEVTSLAIALNYHGFNVTKETLSDDHLPKGAIGKTSPYVAFIGNPRNDNSWYCYSPVIVKCAKNYLTAQNADYEPMDLTGSSPSALYTQVANGHPVIFWATLSMSSPKYYTPDWNINGVHYTKYENLHCMVLTGYDMEKKLVYVADPLRGNVTYNMSTFETRYAQLMKQAVIIRKKP